MTTARKRGTDRLTLANSIKYLKANPGATVQELSKGALISRPTAGSVLHRIATPKEGSWPREWYLKPEYEDGDVVLERVEVELARHVPKRVRIPKAHEYGEVALRVTWPRWIKACTTWPDQIAEISRSTDPKEIKEGLESLAHNAAFLAQAFRQVQNEPDWYERLGGGKE